MLGPSRRCQVAYKEYRIAFQPSQHEREANRRIFGGGLSTHRQKSRLESPLGHAASRYIDSVDIKDTSEPLWVFIPPLVASVHCFRHPTGGCKKTLSFLPLSLDSITHHSLFLNRLCLLFLDMIVPMDASRCHVAVHRFLELCFW